MKLTKVMHMLIAALLITLMSGVFVSAQSNSNELIQQIHSNAVQQVVESESAVGNPYLYNGRRFESETGLYYNRARYYNPDQGRFISRDPIGSFGDEMNFGNAYGYVGNSPLSLSDPSGLSPFAVFVPQPPTATGSGIRQVKIKTFECPSMTGSSQECAAASRGNSIKQVAVILPEAGGAPAQGRGHFTQLAWAKTSIYSPTICPVTPRSKKLYVGSLSFDQTTRAGSQQHKIYDYAQGFAGPSPSANNDNIAIIMTDGKSHASGGTCLTCGIRDGINPIRAAQHTTGITSGAFDLTIAGLALSQKARIWDFKTEQARQVTITQDL